MRVFKRGDRVFFEYHCWQSEKSADAKLWHHTRQYATVMSVLRPPQIDAEAYPTYVIRFADGFVDQAAKDEVTLRPRPNFTRRGGIVPPRRSR